MPDRNKQETNYTTNEERTLPSQAEGERNPGDAPETVDTSTPSQAEGDRKTVEESIEEHERKARQSD
ncbi:MAG TPA: hypothetical protein VHP83_23390 [Aggregatilineaceae bacterium]|nr:hypothetical protein [Aggregatilineaceae bacterium]